MLAAYDCLANWLGEAAGMLAKPVPIAISRLIISIHKTAPAMSRIFGSLFLTAILFRDAFRHHKPLSYLLLLGVFLFLCFISDIIRSIIDWLR